MSSRLPDRELQRPRLGATVATGGVFFAVWAPSANSVAVCIAGGEHRLAASDEGIWSAVVPGSAGDDYRYVVDGRSWPDPASRFQPEGVRGASRVVNPPSVRPGPALELAELVIYELHVGTFTREGTFAAVIPRLAELRALGVSAIELMPVATFPGERNWGYDGLYSSAPHPGYGGPDGLALLIDAAHAIGLGVILDVVYNHVGPGSEALTAFGPYFSDTQVTFWGAALDYSQRGVREWAIQNAELWIRDYRADGLRLDAVHAVVDGSPIHVLRELRDRVKAVQPAALVISEQGSDDLRPLEGWGHDAIWLDSLHHHLHVLLTGERDGYYASFGSLDGVVAELTRPHPERFVVCAQNHDQIGNRPMGDRLPPAEHRVALAIVLFSLSTPLLFMGEEYDERHPFAFFTDHIDPEVGPDDRVRAANTSSRSSRLRARGIPDPQAEQTFADSKLAHRPTDPFFARLLGLREWLPRTLEVTADGPRLVLRRGGGDTYCRLRRDKASSSADGSLAGGAVPTRCDAGTARARTSRSSPSTPSASSSASSTKRTGRHGSS